MDGTEAPRTVVFATPRGPASGYLVQPAGTRPDGGRPAVVVIQEWWGLVPHIEDVTRRVAAEGYLALAPDLYHGAATVEAEEARHLMSELDWGRAAAELAAAVRHLRDVEGATSVGVIGFCMGGALTVIAAAVGEVDAYVAFYGFPPAAAADLDAVEAPGLLLFGEHEDAFSVPDAEAFAARQRARGRAAEVVVLPDAGHAFFNDTRPTYRPAAAATAWELARAHLAAHLV